MSHLRTLAVLAALSSLAAFAPRTAAAQQPDTLGIALTPGTRGLSFALPNGGGAAFGYSRMRSENVQVTWLLSVAARYQHESTDVTSSSRTTLSASIGPAFRRYFTTANRVNPYLLTGFDVGAGYVHDVADANVGDVSQLRGNSPSVFADAYAGSGVEWFPFTQVSIRGEVGIGLHGAYHHIDYSAEGNGGSGSGSSSAWSVALHTFRSSLSLQLYFPRRHETDADR